MLGLSLSFESPVALFSTPVANSLLYGWIISTTGNCTCSMKGKLGILSRNRCHGLWPLMKALHVCTHVYITADFKWQVLKVWNLILCRKITGPCCLKQISVRIPVLEMNIWVCSSTTPVGLKFAGPGSKAAGHPCHFHFCIVSTWPHGHENFWCLSAFTILWKHSLFNQFWQLMTNVEVTVVWVIDYR